MLRGPRRVARLHFPYGSSLALIAAMHKCSSPLTAWKHSMSHPTKLFETYKLGPITLANRLVMAPLTRNRAAPGTFVPSPLPAHYYRQRAPASPPFIAPGPRPQAC